MSCLGAIIFVALTAQATEPLVFTSGTFGGHEYNAPPLITENIRPVTPEQARAVRPQIGDIGYLSDGSETITMYAPNGSVLWSFRDYLGQLVACSATHFVLAENGHFGALGYSRTLTAVLYEARTGKPLWRWYFYELYGHWPNYPDYKWVQDMGNGNSFGIWKFRVQPGFAPSLGQSVLCSEELLNSYIETWTGKKGVSVTGNWGLLTTGESVLPTAFGRGRYVVTAFSEAQNLLYQFRRLANAFELAQKSIGRISVLSKREQDDYAVACSEAAEAELLDTQGSKDEIKELLMERYRLGVRALAKEMQAVIAGPLLPKSGTVSKAFNPNTAYLVRQAMKAQSLSEVERRRVNACWLFDMMKSDIGNFVSQ